MSSLLERHAQSIIGVLSCWDRVVLQASGISYQASADDLVLSAEA
jgi:hypothetical protein